MGLETATVISDLVSSNPASGDARSTADDHLRMIKTCLLAAGASADLEWSVDSTAAVAAEAGQGYVCTNGSAVTVTLPASPSIGQMVSIIFSNGLATNVVARNGNNIGAIAQDCTINSTALVAWSFRYTDSTRGWVLA